MESVGEYLNDKKLKIAKLELMFENCETIIIPIEHVAHLVFDEVYRSISVFKGEFVEELTCKHLIMCLHRLGRYGDHRIMLGEVMTGMTDPAVCDDVFDKYERIDFGEDLVSVCLYFENEDEPPLELYTYWSNNPQLSYINEYQQSYLNEHGDLFLTVSPTMNLTSIWEIGFMDDKEIIDFTMNC